MLAAGVLCAVLAWAAPTAPVHEAKTYFQAGQQAYRAGFYLDAARAFEQAHDLVPNPAITFSLGQTYRRQFFLDADPMHLRRAILAYRQYLQEVPQGGRREDAIENLGALEQRRLALGLQPVQGLLQEAEAVDKTQLMITSQTEDAMAALDGEAPRPVPLVAEVEAGQHTVVVQAPGYQAQTSQAVALQGRLVVAQVDLQAQPAQLKLSGPSGAQVSLDGRTVGKLPFPSALEVAAGRYRVRASQSGKHTFVKDIELGRGQAVEMVARLPTTTQRQISYWFLGGGGVLMLSTGALVAVSLVSEGQARLILRKRDRDMQNLTPAELERYIDARDRRNDLLTISTVTLVGSLVVGGVGAALFFLDDADSIYQPGGISPILTPDGAGVGYSGRF